MKKEKNAKNAKSAKNEKNSRTSGGVCKMPAGTPSSAATGEGYGIDSTTDPAVPNRAHTEM